MNTKVLRILAQNGPRILTGLGIGGFISAVGMAVQATPKAMWLLEKDPRPKLTPFETVKVAWTCYVPTVGMVLLSSACIIGATSAMNKRYAALAGLYGITETAFREYQAKIVETFGASKEEKVRGEIYEKKLLESPQDLAGTLLLGGSDMLCFDVLSGRYFRSTVEELRRIMNNLNKNLLTEMFISQNDLYSEIGLEPLKGGDLLGWDVNKGLIDMTFSAKLTYAGKPCIVVDYRISPRYTG